MADLTDEQKDEVIDRLFDRLENDPALQKKLMNLALKGLQGTPVAPFLGKFLKP